MESQSGPWNGNTAKCLERATLLGRYYNAALEVCGSQCSFQVKEGRLKKRQMQDLGMPKLM